MARTDLQFGRPNPAAPAELSRFAFLIGRWQCDARILSGEGGGQSFKAEWTGRYILDGHAIEDEYRMTDTAGKLIVLGRNYRSYDRALQVWNIKWLNALTGNWGDLAPPELGGARFEGNEVSYVFKELAPAAPDHVYTRATYVAVSADRFTWRGDQSSDAKTWTAFMNIDCHRRID